MVAQHFSSPLNVFPLTLRRVEQTSRSLKFPSRASPFPGTYMLSECWMAIYIHVICSPLEFQSLDLGAQLVLRIFER